MSPEAALPCQVLWLVYPTPSRWLLGHPPLCARVGRHWQVDGKRLSAARIAPSPAAMADEYAAFVLYLESRS